MILISDPEEVTWPCCGKPVNEVQRGRLVQIAALLTTLGELRPDLTIGCMFPTCGHRVVVSLEGSGLIVAHGEQSTQISL